MKRTDWLIGCTVVAALLFLAWLFFPRPALNYEHLDQVWISMTAEGFHCAADREDGKICSGFYVSRQPTGWEELTVLCKSKPRGAEWKGKIWVTTYPFWKNTLMPDDADARMWGGVCAYGDREFLAEVEGALQRGRG